MLVLTMKRWPNHDVSLRFLRMLQVNWCSVFEFQYVNSLSVTWIRNTYPNSNYVNIRLELVLLITASHTPGDLVTQFGGLGRKILTPYPTTARGRRCCFKTPCSISIAKTQQIIPCLPHFLLLNEHSSRPDEL